MQVSKQVLVGAGIVFLALFGAVFFLLGRESRRPHAAAVSPAPAEGMPAEGPPTYAAPPSAPPLPTTAQPAITSEPTTRYGIVESSPRAGIVESSPRGGVVESDPRALPPSVSVTVGGDGAAAVRDYFARMQAIQMYGPTGDTSEFANKLLASSMNGDTAGFDDLIKAAQDGAEKARAITPPAACADYHARMIAMLGESVAMMKQIKTALASGDSGQLAALAASGSSLQNRASALEAEAKQIKARYGLR